MKLKYPDITHMMFFDGLIYNLLFINYYCHDINHAVQLREQILKELPNEHQSQIMDLLKYQLLWNSLNPVTGQRKSNLQIYSNFTSSYDPRFTRFVYDPTVQDTYVDVFQKTLITNTTVDCSPFS